MSENTQRSSQRDASRGRGPRPLNTPNLIRNNQNNNSSALRNIQNIPPTSNVVDDISKKFDSVLQILNNLNENVNGIKQTVNSINSRNDQFAANMEHFNERLNIIGDRLERIERQMAPANGGFSEQMIRDARDQLGLDLNLQLVSDCKFFNKKKSILISIFF